MLHFVLILSYEFRLKAAVDFHYVKISHIVGITTRIIHLL